MSTCRPVDPAPTPTDPVLAARLEAVTSLARHVASPVTVIGRDFSVLYANGAAWAVLARRAGAEPRRAAATSLPAACFGLFFGRSEPCARCPGAEAFRTGESHAVRCAAEGEDLPVGLLEAQPLTDSEGAVACVVEVLTGTGGLGPTPGDLRSVARAATQEAERSAIEVALRQAGGVRTRAARALGISRAGLYNKLKAYGID